MKVSKQLAISLIFIFISTLFISTELKWKGRIPEVIPIEGPYPPTTRPEHNTRTLYPSLFEQCVCFFTSSRTVNNEELKDRAYGLSSLSEKTRKSNHLQVKLQRQHFLLSYLKTLSVSPARVPTHKLPPVVRYLTNWANQSVVLDKPGIHHVYTYTECSIPDESIFSVSVLCPYWYAWNVWL